jgi:hypothetical protein
VSTPFPAPRPVPPLTPRHAPPAPADAAALDEFFADPEPAPPSTQPMRFSPRAEPVAWATAVQSLILAGLLAAKAFGLEVTDDQQTAILAVWTALTPIIGLFVRSKVTPTAMIPGGGP